MNRSPFALVASLVAVLLAGCAATVGTGGGVYVPPTAATTCHAQCQSIGLDLGAVVVMANNVGCVCQPRAAAASAQKSSAVAGGMAALMEQQQQQQQQQAQRAMPH